MIENYTPALRPLASCIRGMTLPARPDRTVVEEQQPHPNEPQATAPKRTFVSLLEACTPVEKPEGDQNAADTLEPPVSESETLVAAPRPGRTCPLSPEELQEFDRVVGERLAKARELNGYNQIAAARLLGYATPAPLSKIEAGQPAPTWLVPRAAQVFSVSSDYLLGLSNYPERDPRTVEQIAILRNVRGAIEDHARRITETTILAAAEEVAAAAHAEELCGAVREVAKALAACRSHPEFDDEVIGGSRLVRTVAEAEAMATTASQYLARRANIRAVLTQNEIGKTATASIP